MDRLQLIPRIDRFCGTCISLSRLTPSERIDVRPYIELLEPEFFSIFAHMPSTEGLISGTKDFLVRLWQSLMDFIKKAIDYTRSLLGMKSKQAWVDSKTNLKKVSDDLDKKMKSYKDDTGSHIFNYESGIGGSEISEHIRTLVSNVYVISDFTERLKYLNIVSTGLNAAVHYIDNHIKINPANPTAGTDAVAHTNAIFNLLTDHGNNESILKAYGIHFNRNADIHLIEIRSINKMQNPVVKSYADYKQLVATYLQHGDTLQATARQIQTESLNTMELSHTYVQGNNPKSLPANVNPNILLLVKLKFKLMTMVNAGANTINADVNRTLNLLVTSTKRLDALSNYIANNLNKDPRK